MNNYHSDVSPVKRGYRGRAGERGAGEGRKGGRRGEKEEGRKGGGRREKGGGRREKRGREKGEKEGERMGEVRKGGGRKGGGRKRPPVAPPLLPQ